MVDHRWAIGRWQSTSIRGVESNKWNFIRNEGITSWKIHRGERGCGRGGYERDGGCRVHCGMEKRGRGVEVRIGKCVV